MGSEAIRYQGVLSSWDDERGFGFVADEDSGRSTFVHISAFPSNGPRPKAGDRLTYSVEPASSGKTKAVQVEYLTAPRAAVLTRVPRSGRRTPADYVPLALFLLLMLITNLQWTIPLWVWVTYAAVSVVTFFAYALDKRAAVEGRWRTSESILLSLGLLGGWPGAIIAQQRLRHKTRKAAFRNAFWGTVAVNVIAFTALVTPAPEWIADAVTRIL